jgi:hypothetical protein
MIEALPSVDAAEAAQAADAERRNSLLAERENLTAQIGQCDDLASQFEEPGDRQVLVPRVLAGVPGSGDSVGLAFAALNARKSAAEAFRAGASTRRDRLAAVEKELAELEAKYRQ